jgi:hypothetical protein
VEIMERLRQIPRQSCGVRVMKLKCLILGCKWRPFQRYWDDKANEPMHKQQCKRCGSTRTVSE